MRPKPGAVTVADLEPALAALRGARVAYDDLRHVVLDVLAPDPCMLPETQRAGLREGVALLQERLAHVQAELDVLAVVLQQEGGGRG
jgi:hypothetical protein